MEKDGISRVYYVGGIPLVLEQIYPPTQERVAHMGRSAENLLRAADIRARPNSYKGRRTYSLEDEVTGRYFVFDPHDHWEDRHPLLVAHLEQLYGRKGLTILISAA